MNPITHLEPLRERFPFLNSYQFNAYGAPALRGNSPVDLGLFLMFIQELKLDSNCVVMAEILSVTELTCKNWITKLREDCLCNVDWHSAAFDSRYFIVHSTGIFDQVLYEQFRGYVTAVIESWKNARVKH